MIPSPSTIAAPRSLTHPTNFRPDPQPEESLGSGATLFATHDQAILGHQTRLIERVAQGELDRATFLRNVGHLESFETRRASLRGEGGLTRSERATLHGEMKKLAGKMTALPHHQSAPDQPVDEQALGLLYEEVREGVVSPREAVGELYWRTSQKYGQTVAGREGPVYADERPKLQAALSRHSRPRRVAEDSPVATGSSDLHPGTLSLVRRTIEIFPLLDTDGDGVVNRNEARTILTDYQQLGLTASQAATLYSRQAALAEVVDPGPASHELMALEDLHGLLPENVGLIPNERAQSALSQVSSRLADQERRIVSAQMPLYLSADGPDGSKVAQGLEGSCWFLGTLPTIEPEQLESILAPEGDHYRMRFADGTSEKVSPLNEAERRVYSRGDGTWSALMEKGMAQKLARTGRDLKGGLTQDALQMLTGAKCDVTHLGLRPWAGPDYRDRSNLAQLLTTTLEAGGAVFTQVNAVDFDPEVSLVSDAKHAYVITAYDAETETVSLRNPWGHGEKADRDGLDDGNFTLSLTELAATFSLVITERTEQAAST